jgi:hypothetical protein
MRCYKAVLVNPKIHMSHETKRTKQITEAKLQPGRDDTNSKAIIAGHHMDVAPHYMYCSVARRSPGSVLPHTAMAARLALPRLSDQLHNLRGLRRPQRPRGVMLEPIRNPVEPRLAVPRLPADLQRCAARAGSGSGAADSSMLSVWQ